MGNRDTNYKGNDNDTSQDQLSVDMTLSFTPDKLSQLENDCGFITEAEVHSNTYIHEQSEASDEWTIEHNLGKYPSVEVVDSSGNVVTTDVIYKSKNKIIVKTNGEFKGYAYLN